MTCKYCEEQGCSVCGRSDYSTGDGMMTRREEIEAEVDYREDELLDALVGHLLARPERATREQLKAAFRDWLKAMLAMEGE